MLTEEREHNPSLAKESLCLCWECALSSSVIIFMAARKGLAEYRDTGTISPTSKLL